MNMLPAKLLKLLRAEGASSFTVHMLSKMTSSLEEFDSISNEDFVLFFEPPSIDDRIVNQYALHSIISNPRAVLDRILVKYPKLYKRIIIPSHLKWGVRDKLDQANINERVLFPGLDGLCKWLTRHYSSIM